MESDSRPINVVFTCCRHKPRTCYRHKPRRTEKNRLQILKHDYREKNLLAKNLKPIDDYWTDYWTKNFLAKNKCSHFVFLKRHTASWDLIKEHPIIKRIKGQKGISLRNFEELYSIPELEEIWK